MVVSYPNQTRNYCIFSSDVNERIKNGESELPVIRESLKNPKSEDEVVEELTEEGRDVAPGKEGEFAVRVAFEGAPDPPVQKIVDEGGRGERDRTGEQNEPGASDGLIKRGKVVLRRNDADDIEEEAGEQVDPDRKDREFGRRLRPERARHDVHT